MLTSKAFRSAIVAACMATSLPSHAAGGAGMATEFTQLANNVELAAGVSQQIKTVAQLAQQYALQLETWKRQLLEWAGTNPDTVLYTTNC